MIDVLINNESGLAASPDVIGGIVRRICLDHGVNRGEVSLAIVDDQTMRQINRKHLEHDYATDVLSFLLERDGDALEGEVIVSADTARRSASDYSWSEQDELLLYVVHGTLHLVGYDDDGDVSRQVMRDREMHYISAAGIQTPQRTKPSGSNWQSKETSL